jgi:hypothetical protein
LSEGVTVLHAGNIKPFLKSNIFENYNQKGKILHLSAKGGFDQDPISIIDGWVYDIPTRKGMCGSPVLIDNETVPRFIAGIHSGLLSTEAVGCIITKEMVDSALANITHPKIVVIAHSSDNLPFVPAPVPVDFPPGVGYIGLVPPEARVFVPNKTQIRPSLVYDYRPHHSEPAVLSHKDRRIAPEHRCGSIIAKGLEKRDTSTLSFFPPQELNAAIDGVYNHVHHLPRTTAPHVLDEEDTINGTGNLQTMNFQSSPGLPYIKMRTPADGVGKAYLFEEIPVVVDGQMVFKRFLKDFTLKRNISDYESAAKNRIRLPSVWLDCLKDERRPMPKIKTASTRIFNIAPVHILYLARKYFGSFFSHMIDNKMRNFARVGIDVHGPEWSQLAMLHDAFSIHHVIGDYSKFDASTRSYLIKTAAEKIDDWYKAYDPNWTEADRNVRRTLMDDLAYSIAMNGPHLVMYTSGLNSGAFMTEILNCLTNDIYQYATWRIIQKKLKNYSSIHYDVYNRNVLRSIYGDDIIASVKAPFHEDFNFITIRDTLRDAGINFTPANKSEKDYTTVPFEEITFLKRSFIPSERKFIYYAPLPLPVIEDIANYIWQHRLADNDQLTRINCEAALREAKHHPRDVYSQLKYDLNKALEEVGIEPLNFQWSDFNLEFMSQFD